MILDEEEQNKFRQHSINERKSWHRLFLIAGILVIPTFILSLRFPFTSFSYSGIQNAFAVLTAVFAISLVIAILASYFTPRRATFFALTWLILISAEVYFSSFERMFQSIAERDSTESSQSDEKLLGSAFREGSIEFDAYTNEIIITTDTERLMEARTGLGEVIMTISGRIRNNGNKTLEVLEVSVGMINSKNELIREKRILFIPRYYAELGPEETIHVSVNIGGFHEHDDRANARWKVTALRFKE